MHSLSFTPGVAARLVVTVTFEAAGVSGGDWGAAYKAHAFFEQSSSTTLGDPAGISTTRAGHTVRGVFDVVAGAAVVCGLWGQISGAVGATFYNISISAELIKR